MSAVETVQSWAERLEAIELARTGAPRKTIRPVVARRVGVAPGTLENLRRGRIKDPRQSLVTKLRAALIRELEAEMRAHEHERHVLIQTGEDPRSSSFEAVDASIAATAEALGLKPTNDGSG